MNKYLLFDSLLHFTLAHDTNEAHDTPLQRIQQNDNKILLSVAMPSPSGFARTKYECVGIRRIRTRRSLYSK